MMPGLRLARSFAPLLIAALLAGCRERASAPASVPRSRAAAVQPASGEAPSAERRALLAETAALLAGLELPAGSPLQPLVEGAAYAEYRDRTERAWRRYVQANLRGIERWRGQHLADSLPATVFYPMGGPDVINALTFFPRARELIVVGLEPPGPIPIARDLPRDEILRWLEEGHAARRTLLTANLFRSGEMKDGMRRSPLASVPALLLFFLARAGYEVDDLFSIAVDATGRARPVRGEVRRPGMMAGCELLFRRRGDATQRRWRYVRLDLSDATQQTYPLLLAGLVGSGELATMLKAASYLPHQPDFSALRRVILERSRLVLEDDSGVPLRYFAAERWTLSVFGRYRVIKKFARKFQPDLDELIRDRSPGELPFAYGYGFSPARSHVIIARRR
jgi:hypothetical protein